MAPVTAGQWRFGSYWLHTNGTSSKGFRIHDFGLANQNGKRVVVFVVIAITVASLVALASPTTFAIGIVVLVGIVLMCTKPMQIGGIKVHHDLSSLLRNGFSVNVKDKWRVGIHDFAFCRRYTSPGCSK